MSEKSPRDINFMSHALRLASRGLGRTAPNPSVGCVIVKGGVVVGRGRTADGGRPHAETVALKHAGIAARGATAYVTLEPCNHQGQTPPCSGALIEAGVGRVVVACTDPDPRTAGAGMERLRATGINVKQGVLEQDALALNAGFFLRITQNRPWVTLKSAVSTDGKIAAAPGQRTQISCRSSMRHVHLLRAQHDAILVGVGTALADDPILTTRIPGYQHNSLRVVLDGQGRLPRDSRLAQAKDNVLILTNDEVDTRDIKAVLANLAQRGVTRLLVEGGAQVNTSFLVAGLCDQFSLTRGAGAIGAGGVEALNGYNIFSLQNDFALELKRTMSLGKDVIEIYGRTV